jgi:UDP-2,4-diacetamido-2,4,6-trideoxy-beta-L-altropyranose hydrolase
MEVAVFRADASQAIGGGHIFRCLTLADALAQRGWRCVFVVSAETATTLQRLCHAPYDVHLLPPGKEADPHALRSAVGEGCSLLVLDNYSLGACYEAGCRDWAHQILVIDDLANRSHECDILLDQNFGRNPLDYRGFVPAFTKILAGATFALLRAEFAAARSMSLARREEGVPAQRVLISLGFTDVGGITARVVDAALEANTGAKLDVVVGEQAKSLSHLRSLETASDGVVLHFDPSDMCHLMVQADIGIGAAGTTSWERCCVGLPTILLVLANNQRFVARNLARIGAARLLEVDTGDIKPNLINALHELFNSKAARVSLARAAAQVTDGLGAKRLIDEITHRDRFVEHHRRDLSLRVPVESDSRLIWSWRNDPVTRSNFRNQGPISWEVHQAWFRSAQADPNIIIFVGQIDGVPIGIIRFDLTVDRSAYELSINLAPEYRSKGLGARLLAASCEKIETGGSTVPLQATVRVENVASQRIFRQCGFYEGQIDGEFVTYWRDGVGSARIGN